MAKLLWFCDRNREDNLEENFSYKKVLLSVSKEIISNKTS